VLRDLSFGRQVASIPLLVYYQWLRDYPELRSEDKEVRDKKLMQLIKSHPEVWVQEKV
jgi:hypothetical protein